MAITRKDGARWVPGVGLLQPDEHMNIMEEVNGDVAKVKAIIAKIEKLALQATINIRNNPGLAIRQMDEVNEGIDLMKRLWGVQ